MCKGVKCMQFVIEPPFWQTGRSEREPVLCLEQENGQPNGFLMRSPEGEVTLTDVYGAAYVPGQDYALRGTEILRRPGSRMPWLSQAEYRPDGEPWDASYYKPYRRGGGLMLHATDRFLVDRLVYATYAHASAQPGFPAVAAGTGRLRKTEARLSARMPVRIALLGDSIGTGCDCSQRFGIHPYLPPWYTQFTMALAARYAAPVEIPPGWNFAVGGKDAAYGAEHAGEAAACKPDLCIIEFGMNDGAAQGAPDAYAKHIEAMMRTVLKESPACEFILCSSLLANPDSWLSGNQAAFRPVLLALMERYDCAAVADFTAMHTAMLASGKRNVDLLANNLNHPNDFLMAAMAQAMLALFA